MMVWLLEQMNQWAAAPLKHDLVFDFHIIHRSITAQYFTMDHKVHLNSPSITSPP